MFKFSKQRSARKSDFSSSSTPWLIVGLGNPGSKYVHTWHNLGFMASEILAQRNNIDVSKSKFKGYYGKGSISGQNAIILRPQTYMNLSGESVIEASRFFKIPAERIIIVYDDIDIAVGKIRIRDNGSAGTHNGMKSVINCLGTGNIPRVRIGYGPVPERWSLIDYVLSEIPDDKKEQIYESLTEGAKAIEKYISEHAT